MMNPKDFLDILHVAERLKDTPRHCTTSRRRTESVAEHSWRVSLMAFLLRNEFPELDMDKVIRMCLIHDLGECFTGDIPTFLKTDQDRETEDSLLGRWVRSLPAGVSEEMSALFEEMDTQQTPESKVYKALDKLEALIQHNESPLDTWSENEYELNKTYAFNAVEFSSWLTNLRQEVLQDTLDKIDAARKPVIRNERPSEYREVENLVRESFWNVYRPGCLEHYVLHCLRKDPAFIPELDFVMEVDGKLIGQCIYMHATIQADDGRTIPIVTMGPIGILPEYKRQGYGKALLDYSLEKAAEMGFGAICFEGNIAFYGKSGFTYASDFGIRYHGLPEGEDASFFLCKELIPGYLDGITGVYATPAGYYVDENECEVFDKDFPPKEKLKLPGQLW